MHISNVLKKEAVFRLPSDIAENTVKDQHCHNYQNLLLNVVYVHDIVFVKGHNAGRGAHDFPKVWETLQNDGCQKGDIKQVLYRRLLKLLGTTAQNLFA